MNPEQNQTPSSMERNQLSKKALVTSGIVAVLVVAGIAYASFAPKNTASENMISTSTPITEVGTTTVSTAATTTPGTGSISSAEKESLIKYIIYRRNVFLSGDINQVKKLLATGKVDLTGVPDEYITSMIKIASGTLKLITPEILRSASTTWVVNGNNLAVEVKVNAGAPVSMPFTKVNGIWQ